MEATRILLAIYLTIIILFGVGWVKNIFKLSDCDFEAPYKAEIIRGVGVLPIAPLGAIVGYMDIND